MRLSLALMTALCSMLLVSSASAGEIFLEANFNDKTIDAPIGTGGPTVGEPVLIDLGPAGAVVRDAPMPTPCLQIVDESDYYAQSVRFEFLGDAEIASGPVVIRADLWIPAQESSGFSLGVRERETSAGTFLTLYFAGGDISATDAHGYLGVVGVYATDQVTSVRIAFDMTAGTYDLSIDGLQVVNDEPHGVVGVGIGAVLFGYLNDAEVGDTYFIDQIYVGDADPTPAEISTWGAVKTQFLGTE